MYNNRALVPDHADYLARWAKVSAAARASQACTLDVPYGGGVGEALDIFPAAKVLAKVSAKGASRGAPVLVFIHGGYWRSLDKADHSFVAPAFTARGACVVVPNYALCPGTRESPVTLPHIALQMARALAWVHDHIAEHGGDPSRITVAGHSAGGHLAAMLLACIWPRVGAHLPANLVRNALSVSGLHELESIRRAPFLQQSLRLTPAQVARCSPAWFPAPAQGALYAVAGADESPEFERQAKLMVQAWGAARVPVCEQIAARNHFSVLDALADPSHRLHALAWQLLTQPTGE